MKNSKNIKKYILIQVIVFAFSVNSVFASDDVIVEDSHKSDTSGQVIAYYDVSTGTETLYTVEDESLSSLLNMDTLISTEPQMPTEPAEVHKLTADEIEENQEAEIDDDSNYESIMPLSEVEGDPRTLVTNLKKYPNYCIAKIFCSKPKKEDPTTIGRYYGTGFAIGKSAFVTARHCITDMYGNWGMNIKAYFAYNGVTNEYSVKVGNPKAYVYYPEYISSIDADGRINTNKKFDIVIIIWEENIIDKTGCFGVKCSINDGTKIKTAGYPKELNGGKRMYKCSGTVKSHTKYRLFLNNAVVTGGQSGSPVFDSNGYAYGLVSHSDASGQRFRVELLDGAREYGAVE